MNKRKNNQRTGDPGFNHQLLKSRSLKMILIMIAWSMIICSCTKKGDGNKPGPTDAYYMRAKLGGLSKTFHTVKFQGGGNDDRWEHIVVGGYESAVIGNVLSPSFDFELWKSGGNISPGTYATPAEPLLIARYAIQHNDGTELYNTSNGKDLFTLKIAAISKSGIQGTFSGTLRNSAGTAIAVTEGEFNLPYDQLVNQ